MDHGRAGQVLRGMGGFYAGEPAQETGPAAEAALRLFHDAARSVPAYAAFLKAGPGEAGPGEAGPEPGLSDRIARAIRAELRRLNSEFAHYVPERS